MNLKKGQSLLELMVVIGIFIISISASAFFILDSFLSNSLASEITKANFLAEEGVEAARAIRDNSFGDLIAGSHGLIISGSHWIFQGTQEDISNELKGGIRRIEVEDVDSNRKKITSKINWQFAGRAEEVRLVSYLTNWQKVSLVEVRKPTHYTDPAQKTINPGNAYDYPDGNTFSITGYDTSRDPSIIFHSWETSTQTYTSLVLKYRYQADGARDDLYAVAYSTTSCTGRFTDLISPTSAAALDTILSVDLLPDQDLTQLCLKIYTEKVRASDGKKHYTRDIWTEGTY